MQRQAQAQQILGDALAAEKRALGQIDEHLAEFWAFVGAARDAFAATEQWEGKILAERQRQIDARIVAGEIESPGPRPVAPNRTSVLAGENAVVRAIAGWRR